jgi:hypothetical protein
MSHETGVDRKPELTAIDNWYATQVQYLLSALDAIPEGTGTLLDNMLVVWGRELANTNHAMQPHPIVLAGGAQGALRTGRFIDVKGEPHAKVLVSIMQMMGMTATTIGNINADSGPSPSSPDVLFALTCPVSIRPQGPTHRWIARAPPARPHPLPAFDSPNGGTATPSRTPRTGLSARLRLG